MKTVHKYLINALSADGTHYVQMPAGAELLHVHMQGVSCYVWARVDTDASPVPRRLLVCPTGGPVPAEAVYVGTFDTGEYAYVWHLFDLGEEEP